MADKSFGVKDINLIGASGTPTIDSPNNLNINAVNVAISTDITVGGKVSLGTGTSISSPAANTLTLGTNSVERLRITSDGNIGIGENSPYYKLHLNTNNNATSLSGGGEGNWGSDGIRIENENTTVGSMSLAHFRTFDADWHIGGKYVGTNDSDFVFLAESNERLRIDSNGRVTTPSQAAALVYKTGTSQSYSADAIVNYDATAYNQGGMTINSNRNRITVPVAGKYMINACASGSCTTASSGDGWHLKILRDGSTYNSSYAFPIETTGSEVGQELAYTLSMVVEADANDYFEIEVGNVGSARADISRGYFGIYLLG